VRSAESEAGGPAARGGGGGLPSYRGGGGGSTLVCAVSFVLSFVLPFLPMGCFLLLLRNRRATEVGHCAEAATGYFARRGSMPDTKREVFYRHSPEVL